MKYGKPPASQSDPRRTHHFEVFWPTRLPPEVAREKHVSDVVARSVVELEHVKWARLKVLEVGFDLQSLQNALLDQVNVPNLVSETEGEKCRRYRALSFIIQEAAPCWANRNSRFDEKARVECLESQIGFKNPWRGRKGSFLHE